MMAGTYKTHWNIVVYCRVVWHSGSRVGFWRRNRCMSSGPTCRMYNSLVDALYFWSVFHYAISTCIWIGWSACPTRGNYDCPFGVHNASSISKAIELISISLCPIFLLSHWICGSGIHIETNMWRLKMKEWLNIAFNLISYLALYVAT